MKGICFIEPLHGKTVKEIKVQTRRLMTPQPQEYVELDNLLCIKKRGVRMDAKPRYTVGEILYMKEPYYNWDDWDPEDGQYSYKFDNPEKIVPYWENKLFMPASAARHYIKITAVRAEKLQDISNEDCIREGIMEVDCIAEDNYNPVYENGYNSTSKKNATLCIQYDTPREAYAALIDAINGKNTWESNPWVWVYNYELIDRKEVQL